MKTKILVDFQICISVPLNARYILQARKNWGRGGGAEGLVNSTFMNWKKNSIKVKNSTKLQNELKLFKFYWYL